MMKFICSMIAVSSSEPPGVLSLLTCFWHLPCGYNVPEIAPRKSNLTPYYVERISNLKSFPAVRLAACIPTFLPTVVVVIIIQRGMWRSSPLAVIRTRWRAAHCITTEKVKRQQSDVFFSFSFYIYFPIIRIFGRFPLIERWHTTTHTLYLKTLSSDGSISVECKETGAQ